MPAASREPVRDLRRLLLVVGLLSLPPGLIALRGAHLTIAEGDQRRAEAEQRLFQRTWLPTTRGRLLDRRGRPLAEDRARYAVYATYDLLAGRWADQTAARLAREIARRTPEPLPDELRALLLDRCRDAARAHADHAWDRIAATIGRPADDLRLTGRTTADRIDRMHRAIVDARTAEAIAALPPDRRTPQAADDARAAADEPIAEMRALHPIADDIPDGQGFALLRIAGERAAIDLDLRGLPIDPAILPEPALRLPILPAIEIRNTAERVHPDAHADVTVRPDALPPPLRRDAPDTLRPRGHLWHILGTVRDRVYREDAIRRDRAIDDGELPRPDGPWGDRGAYRTGDRVGHFGAERGFEHDLRGLRGLRITHLEDGRVERIEPAPGRDVTLTIDAALQRRIHAGFLPEAGLAVVQPWHANEAMPQGTILAGAACVLDVRTSELLALTSWPTPPDLAERPDGARLADELAASWFRPIAKAYPPGSVAKPLIYLDAVRDGLITPDHRAECTGSLFPERPDAYRCWIFKRFGRTHAAPDGGPLSAALAIKYSCNIYFYELGAMLAPDGVAEAYRRFGIGHAFGLGIGPESPGIIGRDDGGSLTAQEAILLGIGQGPVAWTPVHAANALATIARGGLWIAPTLRRDAAPAPTRDLGLDPPAVAEAIRGLHAVANDRDGTGGRIDYPAPWGEHRLFQDLDATVLGKTGTAQAAPLTADPDGDGPQPPRIIRSGDHAWYGALVGPAGEGQPRYAIAVVVEYAGSGGRVAGPLASWIAHALADEGYLDPGSAP